MLDEVGVYRDRDRYLARSLQVTSRMEALVGEILTISRMESGTGLRKDEVDLSLSLIHISTACPLRHTDGGNENDRAEA